MDAPKPLPLGFPWPERELASFCDRWDVQDLAVFGSALREDFAPDSDVDLRVRFGPDAPWTLLDMGRMERELEEILGRRVDLVTREAIRAWRGAGDFFAGTDRALPCQRVTSGVVSARWAAGTDGSRRDPGPDSRAEIDPSSKGC